MMASPHQSTPPDNHAGRDGNDIVEDTDDTFRQLVAGLEALETFIADFPLGKSEQSFFIPAFEDKQSIDQSFRYVETFPVWTPFSLFSITKEDTKTTVLIHPVNSGRCAVPVLLKETKQGSQRSPSPMLLWDACELRFLISLEDERYNHHITDLLSIWNNVIQLLIVKPTFSFNDIIGTYVLGRSFERNLSMYSFNGNSTHPSYQSDLQPLFCVAKGLLSKVDAMFIRFIQSDDEQIASLWVATTEAIGY
jgi:hypothetical protein